MPPRLIDREEPSTVATITAALFGVLPMMAVEGLLLRLIGIDAQRIFLVPSDPNLLALAAMAVAGFVLGFQLCRALGRTFIGLVACIYGAFFLIAGGWMLTAGTYEKGVVVMVGAAGISVGSFGVKSLGYRRLALLALVLGIGWFGYYLLRGNFNYAAGGAAVALVAGVLSKLLEIDPRALRDRLAWQLVTEWRNNTRSNFVQTLVALMLCVIGVAFFNREASLRHPVLEGVSGWWTIVGWLATGFAGLVAAVGILHVVVGVIRSLLAVPASNIDAVASQKVHGNAGYAGRSQVDAALRDKGAAGSSPPRFRD